MISAWTLLCKRKTGAVTLTVPVFFYFVKEKVFDIKRSKYIRMYLLVSHIASLSWQKVSYNLNRQ